MVLVVKYLLVNVGNVRDVGSTPGSGRSPGGGHSTPLQYACLENPTDRRDWRATVHRAPQNQTWLKWLSTKASGRGSLTSLMFMHLMFILQLFFWASLIAQLVKNLPAMQETWVWSLGQEDPLEKEMATHSSILAWRIPWTEEPGRLQSMGLQESDTPEWLSLLLLQLQLFWS